MGSRFEPLVREDRRMNQDTSAAFAVGGPLSDADLLQMLAGENPPHVICSNTRLAQQLMLRYAQHQSAVGRVVFETPTVLVLGSWLELISEFGVGQHLPPAATAAQSRALWRSICQESKAELPLLRDAEAAASAARAYTLVRDYRLQLPIADASADSERFCQWAVAYQEACHRAGLLDPADRRAALIQCINAGQGQLPAAIVFAGFDVLPPSTLALVDALRSRGIVIYTRQPPQIDASRTVISAPNAESEIRQAAEWALNIIAQDPGASVGIVVPNLTERRAQVVRIMDEMASPEALRSAAPATVRAYNVSLGAPLADYPLVSTALMLLRLCAGEISDAECTALLCSPYHGATEADRFARSAADAAIRRAGYTVVRLADISRAGRLGASAQAPFDQAALLLQQLPRKALPSEWVEVMLRVLEAFGWPGYRSLSSDAFQAQQAFTEGIRQLVELDGILGPINLQAAARLADDICSKTPWQPKVGGAPIQVLGALESAGQEFDALWVAGLDDEHWPMPGSPSALLPFSLQRSNQLPFADPVAELRIATEMLDRWSVSAPEVVFSYPNSDSDRELAPSPMLSRIQAQSGTAPDRSLPAAWRQAIHTTLESLLDEHAPPLPDGATASGGARALGDQAACPFRSFAVHRLGARSLETPQYGLTPRDRGNLVHAALDLIWTQLRSHERLVGMDPADLSALIGQAVDQAVSDLVAKAPHRVGQAIASIESLRLRRIASEWMEHERKRLPFTVVVVEGRALDDPEGSPSDDTVSLGGISMKVRPDRVDQLEGGGRMVLDYKSGTTVSPPWRDDRPEDPALAIYAQKHDQVIGVSYGRVAAGKVGFLGVGVDEEIAPGVSRWSETITTSDLPDWGSVMTHWRGALTVLAEEHKAGVASVSPKDGKSTCKFCDVKSLCRVREKIDLADADGESQ